LLSLRSVIQKCHQEEGQSIREFLAKLQKLAETCEFGTYRDEALSDRLVCGINSKVTRRKLLGEADIETTADMLYLLFEKIWEVEEVPLDWKEGYLIKLPKKGGLSNCTNYRAITLQDVSGKVFNRALLNRMKDEVDTKFGDQQAGFRKDRSCVDQIATLRIIIKQSCEWNSPLFISFVDFEEAFDSVDRDTLWKLLRRYGVPVNIVNIIRSSYEGLS